MASCAARPIVEFHLLSFHGSLVVRDGTGGRMGLASIESDAEKDLVRLAVATDAESVVAILRVAADAGEADVVVAVHETVPSGRLAVVLRCNGAFVTAVGGTDVHFGTTVCNEWEIFLLVRADEIELLREIIRHPRASDRRQVTLGAGHRLRIGAQTFSLAEWGDLVSVLLDNLVTLPGHAADGASVYLRAAPARRKRIWIRPLGNSANRALQYLVAARLAAEVEGAQVENIHLPEWSIESYAQRPPDGMSVTLGLAQQSFDLSGIADCLDRGVIDTVIIETYPFNITLYPDLATCRLLLRPAPGTDCLAGFGADELVCNIRGGEILTGGHHGYIVLPPSYYRALADRTGLRLVFFGQIGDDPYCDQLRAAFPDARFVPGTSPQADFETLRRSRHIAVAISTFSWLAAWLSDAETIHVPICGMFSPVQYPEQSYLPVDDPRYHFILLPYARMVDLYGAPDAFAELQATLANGMRPLTRAEAKALCQAAARFAPRQALLRGFDPCHYLAHCPEAAAAFFGAMVDSPLQHYISGDYDLRRRAIPFDEGAYLRRRPEAAVEVALGLYSDPLHHYLAAPKPSPASMQEPGAKGDMTQSRSPRLPSTLT